MGKKALRGAREIIDRWKVDYDFKTFINSFGSTLITFVFAIFNGFLGIVNDSPWYISIAVYYAMLSAIRSYIIIATRNVIKERTVYLAASSSLLLIDISLVAPIAFLVKNEKPISSSITMIPSISMAAYTPFKVTMAAINQAKKRRRSESMPVRLLRTINMTSQPSRRQLSNKSDHFPPRHGENPMPDSPLA